MDGQVELDCHDNTGYNGQGFDRNALLFDGSKPHKLETGGCGTGKDDAHLGKDEPKLYSQPLPCSGCVIHRWYPGGADTSGCLGIQPKMFDWVYKNCGGCSYTIIPKTGGGGGGGGNQGGQAPVGQ